eukprot:gene33817-36530_t
MAPHPQPRHARFSPPPADRARPSVVSTPAARRAGPGRTGSATALAAQQADDRCALVLAQAQWATHPVAAQGAWLLLR